MFLPIVSLGDELDKDIPWGATIPDDQGNYYYTSFSPAGYIMPWMFLKIFSLPISEGSLYIFNSLLLCISALLWTIFLTQIFNETRNGIIIAFIGTITYITIPEIMHGMGIVYWHQSLYQVTFLLQLIAWYQYRSKDKKRYRFLFYILCLINEYSGLYDTSVRSFGNRCSEK